MLYLFNNIYLKLDVDLLPATDCVIISGLADTLPQDDFGRQITEQDLGTVHFAARTYDDVIAAAGSEAAFFDFLSSFDPQTKLMIYASPDAYITIMEKWYKGLLRNITPEWAYKLFKMILLRHKYTLGYTYNPRMLVSESGAAAYQSLYSWMPAEADFVDIWKAVVPFDMSKQGYDFYAQRCGIEFQLASYLADPAWKHKDVLETKAVKMARTTYINVMCEMIATVLQRVNKLPGLNLDVDTVDLWVAKNPRYAFIVDPNFNSSNLEYIAKTYDYALLRDVFIELITLAGFTPVMTVLDDVLLSIATPTLDKIIDVELQAVFYPVILGASDYAQTVDSYIVNYLLEDKRNSRVEFATQLLLE